MYVTLATLLALQCILCLAIKVPVEWSNENSEVYKNNQFAVEEFGPQNGASSNQKPIPKEYFEYPAHKPKFAVDIARFHGVQSPENHYKAYPVKPHIGVQKAELGKHQILDKANKNFHPFQEYVKKNEAIRTVSPSSTSYEVFHPYKLEVPALKELYRDPVMQKIRSNLDNNIVRLQKYEIAAGKPDIIKEEYLETPEETDQKKVPHKNVPAPYEIHRPQRRPIYYRPPPIHNEREEVLNQKLKHPWHQNHVKVKPAHYGPVKNHLQGLRQQHALKYDDERNEYPQLPLPEKHNEPPEGYDIYEKGKEKFVQLQNNVDESLNEAVQKNRPTEKQTLELSDDEYDEDTTTDDDEDDFVPIKNYAQVRKTETTKHLPKEAAYHDADTLEEIQNAPRLREAVKSTKAQTVYSEEGYEDSAYDHAGEQKHASDHEEHRGLLKQKELSNGKFKSPTLNDEYENEEGSRYRNQVTDDKKWKNSKKNTDKERDSEEYSVDEQENSDENDNYVRKSKDREEIDIENEPEDEVDYDSREDEIKRIKREPINIKSKNIENILNVSERVSPEREVNKHETKLKDLKVNVNTTDQIAKEIAISKLNLSQKLDKLNDKYPYYYNKIKGINKNSPLRYAENLRFIPNKSEGGTEFYDSRKTIQCPEVEDNIDPIPEKLKKGGHPDDDDNDDEDSSEEKHINNSSGPNQMPRLKGLGDKIDCFRAKYFGENPLDSPFFKEEVISNPEPVTIPSIDIYRLKQAKQKSIKKINIENDLYNGPKNDRFNPEHNIIKHEINAKNTAAKLSKPNISNNQLISLTSNSVPKSQINSNSNQNTTLQPGTKISTIVRKKRAAPFVYEPYKIIRDSQIQDSKKTTTTNNISPLIKQLQSSRIADKVTTNTGKEPIVKRNAVTRTYKDIGKSEREKKIESKGSQPLYDARFVDVNLDQRRGEPRYELRSINHENQYSSAENKRSEDHIAQTKINAEQQEDKSHNRRKANRRRRTTTTVRPFFDVSKFLPQERFDKDNLNDETQTTTNEPIISPLDKSLKSIHTKQDSAENDDNEENTHGSTTTTKKGSSKRKVADTTTTAKPDAEEDFSLTDIPKLRLVSRFRNVYQTETPVTLKRTEIPTRVYENDKEIKAPKYREKKKKISKSTLVTDTNSYGEDIDDDLSKEEEVDALIGVNHDIQEFLPTYEKERRLKDTISSSHSENQNEDEEDYEEDDHSFDDEEEETDDDEDDDDNEEVEEDEDEEVEKEENLKPEVTSPESPKRTLIRTTETPLTTTEARSANLKIEPIIVERKLDIHKELPVNSSSPHITEFKQDIKEVEIIKELPSNKKKIPQKNIEALELYKDENLAKDVNKLGGVEIFKEGLDLINGPKHGGNYRIAETHTTDDSSKGDVVASQSKTSKIIEIKEDPYSRRRSDIQRARNNRNRNAKIIELSETTERPISRSMHGGNLKSIQDMRRRGGNRNAKIIELVDQNNRGDHSTNKQDDSSRSYGSRGGDRHQMHGGNYRSAKLVKANDKVRTKTENVTKKDTSIDERQNSAVLLNSFARAVSVLTTPTPYILDPSKRMYYYVES